LPAQAGRKWVLGGEVLYLDMPQIVGILVGIISGLTWERLGTTPYKNISSVIPSLIIEKLGKPLHLHHWPFYLLILVIVGVWSMKTERIFHPAILFVIFFLLSAIIYDFIRFPDSFKFSK